MYLSEAEIGGDALADVDDELVGVGDEKEAGQKIGQLLLPESAVLGADEPLQGGVGWLCAGSDEWGEGASATEGGGESKDGDAVDVSDGRFSGDDGNHILHILEDLRLSTPTEPRRVLGLLPSLVLVPVKDTRISSQLRRERVGMSPTSFSAVSNSCRLERSTLRSDQTKQRTRPRLKRPSVSLCQWEHVTVTRLGNPAAQQKLTPGAAQEFDGRLCRDAKGAPGLVDSS